MTFFRYVFCPCLLCCRNSNKKDAFTPDSKTEHLSPEEPPPWTPEQQQEYDDLIYLATKGEIKCTIRKSTQAGVAAGLSVMAGTLVAGPIGAAAGGAIGTALAVSMSKNIVPLNTLLEQTPQEKRGEVVKLFNEAFKEEFIDTIENSPELKLVLSGRHPIGVVRYMVERDIIKNEKLEKLDGILSKVM